MAADGVAVAAAHPPRLRARDARASAALVGRAPLTRRNEQTSCGEGVPVVRFAFTDAFDGLKIEMIPKGSGSENNSWLKMAIPADGVDAIGGSSSTACSTPAARPVRRRSSASVWAARRTCACIWPRSRQRGRSAPRAPTRKARASRRS